MVYTTQELLLKYKEMKTPHVKIRTEVKNGRLFPVVRGLYATDENIPSYLLVCYIKPFSYISFEYVLSRNGLIPERVSTITAATSGKSHYSQLNTAFGNFFFRDVPMDAYRFGVRAYEEAGYGYLMATPEKALCDLLSKKSPVSSMKEFRSLLFDDLRLDEQRLFALDKEDILSLCPKYRKNNLNYLARFVEGCDEFNNKPDA